jgi:hypothetical protein
MQLYSVWDAKMGVTHRDFLLFCLTSEYPYESLFRKTLAVALHTWIGVVCENKKHLIRIFYFLAYHSVLDITSDNIAPYMVLYS